MSDDSHDAPPSTRRGHHMIPPFLAPRPGRHAAEPPRTVRTPAGPRAPTPLFTPPSTTAQHAIKQTTRRAASDPAPAPGATDENSPRGAEPTAALCEELSASGEAPSAIDQIDPAEMPESEQPADLDTPASALFDMPSSAPVAEPGVDGARGCAAWDVAAVEQPLAEVGDAESDDDWFGIDDNVAGQASADAGRDDASSWFDELDDMNGLTGGTEAAHSTAGGEELRACECEGEACDGPAAAEAREADEQAMSPQDTAPADESAAPCPIEGTGASDTMHAEVAAALERVAHRIRGGDVPLPADLPATSDTAALAAVLAALLRPSS